MLIYYARLYEPYKKNKMGCIYWQYGSFFLNINISGNTNNKTFYTYLNSFTYDEYLNDKPLMALINENIHFYFIYEKKRAFIMQLLCIIIIISYKMIK